MDTARAHPVQLKARRAGLLVAFFGDNSWGWFTPDLLISFSEHAQEKGKQRTLQKVGGRVGGWMDGFVLVVLLLMSNQGNH